MTPSTDQFNPPLPPATSVPRLVDGQQLTQPEFHRRYLAMPPNFRAELIDGVVVLPSPLKNKHGFAHGLAVHWLYLYRRGTHRLRIGDNTTAILANSEVQPDAFLMIDSAYGGQASESADGYTVGAPELVVEVADSSESMDLNLKFREYQKAGVREYLVVLLRRQTVRWFSLESGVFQEIGSVNGVLQSRVFPGLWLNIGALLNDDQEGVETTLRQGTSQPEHAHFVQELKNRPGSPRFEQP